MTSSMPIPPSISNSGQYNLSFKTAPAAPEPRLVINCSPPHHIVNVNPAWEAMWGHTQSDTEGQTFPDMITRGFSAPGSTFPPSAEKATSSAIMACISEVRSSRASECVALMYAKGGLGVVAHLTCVPLPDKKYGTTHFLLIGEMLNCRDVMDGAAARGGVGGLAGVGGTRGVGEKDYERAVSEVMG